MAGKVLEGQRRYFLHEYVMMYTPLNWSKRQCSHGPNPASNDCDVTIYAGSVRLRTLHAKGN